MATKKETVKKPAAKKAAAPKKATTTKKAAAKKVEKPVEQAAPQHIGLVQNDPWLEPFEGAIRGRHDHAVWKLNQLTNNGKKKLSDFATGHLYFGLHKVTKGWVFREWAPNATDIYLIGDFNNWKEDEKYRCKRVEGTGNWELKLPEKALKHGDLYKMMQCRTCWRRSSPSASLRTTRTTASPTSRWKARRWQALPPSSATTP